MAKLVEICCCHAVLTKSTHVGTCINSTVYLCLVSHLLVYLVGQFIFLQTKNYNNRMTKRQLFHKILEDEKTNYDVTPNFVFKYKTAI